MNWKEFGAWLEGYYGKYPRRQLKEDIAEYIKDVPEADFPSLVGYLKINFSTQYNFTPDIATLETARLDMKPKRQAIGLYKPTLPEPEARSMDVEVGQLMQVVLKKVSINREEREKDERA